MYFLKAAVNAVRAYQGREQLDAMEFLDFVETRKKVVKIRDDLLERAVNSGFSGGEKKRNEIFHVITSYSIHYTKLYEAVVVFPAPPAVIAAVCAAPEAEPALVAAADPATVAEVPAPAAVVVATVEVSEDAVP